MNYNPVYPFYCHSRQTPDRIALWVDGTAYTYQELATQASRISAWLRPAVNADVTRVAILSHRTLAAYQGILGACWSGACYVPLNPAFPDHRLQTIIALAKPDVLLIDAKMLKRLTTELLGSFAGPILVVDGDSTSVADRSVAGLDRLPELADLVEPVAVDASAGAYLVFTSGSTGTPNGAVLSCGNLDFAIRSLSARYPFDPDDRFSQFFDLSFDFSVMDLFVPWSVGASTYVVPDLQKMAPGRFINDHALTVWTGVPSLIMIMARMRMLKAGIFPSLRFSCFSGETLTVEAARLWREAAANGVLVNLYGQTEAPIGSLVQTCGDDSPVTEETHGVALGTELDDVFVGIVNRDGQFVEPETAGELAVSGPHVAAGYLDNPQRTAEKFRELDHPRLGVRSWYLTGDLARQDRNGVYHFLGRVDNELKIKGHRVVLEEVEHHLRRCSGCRVVAVVPWRSDLDIIEGLTAFVVGQAPAEKLMKESLAQELPVPLVPWRIETLETMPLNRNGKVDRKALEELHRKK